MSSITSFDRLLTMLGMFCRDELRREGFGVVLHETADNEREYLARHNVLPEWWNGFSGRGRFDELAVRVRDYPSPLPANVQENRAVFDELKRELKLIELDTERPEPEIWQKIDSLRARLQDNSIDCELLPTDGLVKVPPVGNLTAEGWCFGEKKLEFPPILRPVLKAYIAGKKDFRRTDCGNLRQRKSELKSLIQRAMDEAGYKPVPNRWPKSTKLDGGGVIILFNGRDDENTRTQGAGKTG